jgi:hypothetical protein
MQVPSLHWNSPELQDEEVVEGVNVVVVSASRNLLNDYLINNQVSCNKELRHWVYFQTINNNQNGVKK